MTQELQRKVDFAIKLIQSASKIAEEHGQPIEVCYSGGKDSDVILELTRMANVPYRAIYKNTTIDPPHTIAHCKENGVEIHQPKKRFFDLIKQRGFPTRRVRMCCSELKEYKILDYAILGIRRTESAKRAERYKEPEQCRVYSKKEKCRQYFPILEWSNADVYAFIQERGIKCHPLYYDNSTPPNSLLINDLGVLDAHCEATMVLRISRNIPTWLRLGARQGKCGLTQNQTYVATLNSIMPTSYLFTMFSLTPMGNTSVQLAEVSSITA